MTIILLITVHTSAPVLSQWQLQLQAAHSAVVLCLSPAASLAAVSNYAFPSATVLPKFCLKYRMQTTTAVTTQQHLSFQHVLLAAPSIAKQN
jgi:hypothetical protein